MSTNVLITGASRGLGLAMTKTYLSRPNHTVIAGVRDPSSPSVIATFDSIPRAKGSALIVAKLDVTSPTDASEAIQLAKHSGIGSLDVVIANAGLSGAYKPASTVDADEVRKVFDTNVLGVLKIFQASLPLLENASKGGRVPKFVTISSAAGSIASLNEAGKLYAVDAYGISKAGVNFLSKAVSVRHEELISVALHPGLVQTDMGNDGAKFFGMEKALITVDESVEGMIKIIDNATHDKTSGKFLSFDGTEVPW